MAHLLKRLRERKLFQWALAYLAVAWALFQGVEVLAEPWSLPPALQRTIHLLVAVGFLVTLVLAWYHGEKGRQRVSATELVVIGLLLSLGAVLILTYKPAEEAATGSRELETIETPSAGEIRSLAVLPLANLTGDPSQAYFVDGLHDILISELAGISELTVISRTSVLRYRDSERPLGAIAAELGVDALVEGSVFRAGDSVRVNVQLVRGFPEEHVWQNRYAGRLSEALDLQTRIARAVAREIQLSLLPREEERLARRTVVDPAAQEAYLRGRALWRTRSPEAIRRSLSYLEQAAATDSTFALAWSGLADAYTMGTFYGGVDVSHAEAFRRAERYAMRALELDPDLSEAHGAVAGVRLWGDWDPVAAEQHLRQALRLNPNYSQAYNWLGDVHGAHGDVEIALESFERARALDPFSALMNRDLARGLMYASRYEDAIAAATTAIELDANHAEAYDVVRHCMRALGRLDKAAQAAIARLRAMGLTDSAGRLRSAYDSAGWEGVVEVEIEIFRARGEYIQAAFRYVELQRVDEAFDAVFAGIDAHEGRVLTLRAVPFFEPLRSDPRWEEALRRAGF